MNSQSRVPLPAVLLCLLISGSASLGLEVVWSRQLVLVYGSTSLAVTTTLVATMLGFGLGGLLGGRFAVRVRNGVRAYGWMEVCVGLYALLVPTLLRALPPIDGYLIGLFGRDAAPFIRFGLSLLLLLFPTMAMGATLPLLVNALTRSDSNIGSRTGLLYGVNTTGAVLGVLGATFVAFRYLGLSGTNTAAAALDLLAGGIAIFLLAPRLATAKEVSPSTIKITPSSGKGTASTRFTTWAYAFVGASALAYEVSWTRALAMVVGSSTYAFATMLAGFLAGIALGSLLIHRILDRLRNPALVFGAGVTLLGCAAWGVSSALDQLPNSFLSLFQAVGISGTNLVWLSFSVTFVLLLAPTLVLGALFPLCVRTLVNAGIEKARAVGTVYFVNTIGSAAGAFCTGFLMIPHFGLGRALGIWITIDLFLGAALLFSAGKLRGAKPLGGIALVLSLFSILRPFELDEGALSVGVYYRSRSRLDFDLAKIPMPGVTEDELLFYRDGLNATISVHRTEGGLAEGGLSLHINGKSDASIGDMSTQVLSGHLPMLFGTEADRVLVIGLASGVTTGAVTLYKPSHVDVCEIEEAVVEASHFFDDFNHRPLQNARVQLHIADGRSFLRENPGGDSRWDVVISEPSNPWMAGCANLFTREFFELARACLQPGGRLLQWVQLYGMDPDGLRAILAALHESFPHVQGFLYDEQSNDLLLLASDRALKFDDLPRLEEQNPMVRRDLARVRVLSTADIWSLLALNSVDLAGLAEESTRVNSDNNLFVELGAPLRLYDDTPETSELLLSRGNGFAGLDDVLEQAPDELLAELAVSYLDRRYSATKADHLHSMLSERGDESGFALYQAARILALGGDIREAGDALNRAVRLGPDRFLNRYQRAWFANQHRVFDAALADLDLALGLRPEHYEAAYQRSRALAGLGRVDEARAAMRALIAGPLLETDPQLLVENALLNAHVGDFQQASESIRRYLKLEPYSPREWRLLADWQETLGDKEEAASAASNAELAQANVTRELRWISRWHENFGTQREALAALRAALSQAPENAEIQADIKRLEGSVASSPQN